jgi:hypothetical protein
MTPKKKASNLVDKFLDLDNYNNLNLDLFCDECGMSNEAAKICALIAVDELLEFENRVIEEWRNYFEGKGGSMKVERIFWEEVKHEIQKL